MVKEVIVSVPTKKMAEVNYYIQGETLTPPYTNFILDNNFFDTKEKKSVQLHL
jgi:hypothetical protein